MAARESRKKVINRCGPKLSPAKIKSAAASDQKLTLP